MQRSMLQWEISLRVAQRFKHCDKHLRNSRASAPEVLKVYQRRSTSMTAWAKACGASCGILWPTPPVMSR
jgi:hypothetical protein